MDTSTEVFCEISRGELFGRAAVSICTATETPIPGVGFHANCWMGSLLAPVRTKLYQGSKNNTMPKDLEVQTFKADLAMRLTIRDLGKKLSMSKSEVIRFALEELKKKFSMR